MADVGVSLTDELSEGPARTRLKAASARLHPEPLSWSRAWGLQMIIVKAGSESEIEAAIVAAVHQQANALSIGNGAYLSS
jgi:hypothetical protein